MEHWVWIFPPALLRAARFSKPWPVTYTKHKSVANIHVLWLYQKSSKRKIRDHVWKGKKALFGILLLKTIYRDDDNKITSFRMQWLEKGAVDGPEADVAMAQNRLIENLQSAFPQMLVENPARVKQCVRIALQVQLPQKRW